MRIRDVGMLGVALSFALLSVAPPPAGGLSAAFAQAGTAAAEPAPDVEDSRSFARSLSRAFEYAAERVEPAVVHITTKALIQQVRRSLFGNIPVGRPREVPRGLGSGVIIDESGLILTNNHVIAQGDRLIVRLADEREFEAELIGADPEIDLAVLKIDADGLTAADFGDSDTLHVGEWVLAIGSPFGFEQTVTAGIVSAKSRGALNGQQGARREYIQTDASINPGNSGGPLINLDGEIVGINTAIISSSGQSAGLGFAIPSTVAEPVVELILNAGRVERGYLGIGMADLTPEARIDLGLAPNAGVAITRVEPGTPADEAGLRERDIILSVNGRVVDSEARLQNLIGLSGPGSEIELEVLRNGRRLTRTATLVNYETLVGVARVDELGLAVQPLTPEAAAAARLPAGVEGAIIVAVYAGGPASRIDLRPGDLIIEFDGGDVDDPADLRRLVGRARGTAEIEVLRGRARYTGEIEIRR